MRNPIGTTDELTSRPIEAARKLPKFRPAQEGIDLVPGQWVWLRWDDETLKAQYRFQDTIHAVFWIDGSLVEFDLRAGKQIYWGRHQVKILGSALAPTPPAAA